VYLATYYTDFQHPVFDPACAYVIWKGRDRGSCDAAGLTGDAPQPPLLVSTPAERAASTTRILRHAEEAKLSGMDKELLLRELAARLGVDYARIRDRRLLYQMSADEVRALPRELVQVELHTHRHRTPGHPGLFAREIEDNRRRISELTGGNGQVHFCYPSGYLREEFLPWLRDAGVETATTCLPGISTSESEPLLLPRLVDTTLLSEVAFEAWVSGFAALLPRSRASRAVGEFDRTPR
jgi:peptidoglycan/xylan/chitin deacetylase (PgdA/CDA1 family)